MSYSRFTNSRFYTWWDTSDRLGIADADNGPEIMYLNYKEAKELRGYIDAFIADWEIERDG